MILKHREILTKTSGEKIHAFTPQANIIIVFHEKSRKPGDEGSAPNF